MPWGIPYRGQPRPNYPKPRRQIRYLAEEKGQYIFTMVVFFAFSLMVLGTGIWFYITAREGLYLFLTIVVFITFVIVGFMVADGLRSVNKFRKGYDIDISDLEHDEKEEHTKKKYAHHD